MASIRTRRLAGGAQRWDVQYSQANRLRCITFHDQGEAEAYARLVNLRHQRRWPLAPLLERTGLTARQLAEAQGLQPSAGHRYANDGLTDVQADRWATHLGYHPAQVWGWPWVAEALSAEESA